MENVYIKRVNDTQKTGLYLSLQMEVDGHWGYSKVLNQIVPNKTDFIFNLLV